LQDQMRMWLLQLIENGAGDGTRTRDVQLGKMGNGLFSIT